MGESDAIFTSLGGAYTFVTTLGIVKQSELADASLSGKADMADVERLLRDYDRIVKHQVQLANLLMRREAALAKKRQADPEK